jgi:UrcA family protein
MTNRLVTVALAAVATLAAVQPATAQTADQYVSRTVSLAGLDLSSDSGRRIADRRIAKAVEAVCGSYATVETAGLPAVTACRRVARASADRQLALRTTGVVLAAAR